jgi:hypothetical protein
MFSAVSAAACFTESPIFRAASEDAPLPLGYSPQAAKIARFDERTVSTSRLSTSCFVSPLSTCVLQVTAFENLALHRQL